VEAFGGRPAQRAALQRAQAQRRQLASSWRRWLIAAAVLLTAASGTADDKGAASASHVTVPLADYEALARAQEHASVTVVDVLRLAGGFKGQTLSVAFSGRAAGNLPPVDVLSASACSPGSARRRRRAS
jgi:hypothetical protein